MGICGTDVEVAGVGRARVMGMEMGMGMGREMVKRFRGVRGCMIWEVMVRYREKLE